MNEAQQFIKKHQLSSDNLSKNDLVKDFLNEMEAGLGGNESSLQMIPTYIEADKELKSNLPVIAIDAGGTNFRTAKVHFDDNMQLIVSDLKSDKMPALEKELTPGEFFKAMAVLIEDYKDYSDKIGLCFSYAVEIYPNKDGKLLEWSKEVKAPGVIGMMVGKNLLDAMGTPDKHLVVLNDTVATLLAGQAATAGKTYDTYIGFILGTGTNTCYIESNKNIIKAPGLVQEDSQIINIESGNFAKVPRTDIDLLFDTQTKFPGRYSFEKMFAGGYFGGLCTTALRVAANEGVFSEKSKYNVKELQELSAEEVNNFILNIDLNNNRLAQALATGEDKLFAAQIIEALIERAAKLVAANLGAVILKTGKAKSEDKPVLMTIEGTTFYKLKNFRKMFENFLKDFLSGNNQRYYEIVEVENSSLIGAAIAGIVN
jgi:hexokinase